MEKNSLLPFFEVLSSKFNFCLFPKNIVSRLGFLFPNLSHLSKISLMVFIFLVSYESFAQVAPVDPPVGGFRIEGDVKANFPTAGQGDWVSGAQGVGTNVIQFVSPNWVPVNSTTTKFIQDAYNSTSDLIFSGSSFSDNPNTVSGINGGWKWTTGKATNKCDINNAMYHVTTSSDSKWIILGGDRFTTTGTSYIDFEFLQNTLIRENNNTFTSSSSNATGGRKVGDFVLSMEYSNGGTNATVHYYRWELSGTDYKYVEQTIPNDINGNPYAFAMTNGATTDAPYSAFGSTSYIPFAFVEAAVNIDGILSANCESLSIKTIFVKTKASDSYNAALKDFVEPQQVNFQFGTGGFNYSGGPYCNEGTVSPTAVTGTGSFAADLPGLVFNNTTTGEINLATSTPGTYLVTYTYQTGPGCTKPATQSITINPKPTAGISGTTAVCKNATAPNVTFTGSGGTTPYTFSYTVNGASQTVSTTGTNSSVTVAAPTSTASTFTYALTGVQDAYCSNTATGSAVISVRPLPTALISGATAVCKDASSPDVTFTGSGGTTPYTFNYTINGVSQTAVSTTGTNSSVTVAGPTGTASTFTYALTGVQDAYCSNTATGSAVITVRALPTAIISGTTAVCKDASSPNVTFTGSGGTTPYTFNYTVNGASQTVSTTGTNSSVTLAAPTGSASTFTYALTGVQDANCSNTASGSVVITIDDQPAAPTFCVVLPSLCDITKKGSLTILTPTGAPGVYEYSINNGANFQLSSVFNNLDPGAVTGVKVKNMSTGCISSSANCDESNICSSPSAKKTSSKIVPVEEAKTSNTETEGFEAYPVPFKDQLTIKYNFDYVSDVKIEVFNAQGISVLSKNDTNSYLNKEITLNLNSNSGREQVYVVKVTTNRGSSTKKVMSSR
jgi:hypothetical protein